MSSDQENINLLLDRLNILLEKQETFSREINELRDEINLLKTSDPGKAPETPEAIREQSATAPVVDEVTAKSANEPDPALIIEPPIPVSARMNKPPGGQSVDIKSNLEKFIGENLINKIGIVITIIGVAIGAKYSIEHELISPLTRIILGYLSGIALLGVGMKLKKNYENYSAVLVSGSMAIMYFITYAAFDFYHLTPQGVAFGLMLVFTAFTVGAALNYNKQVIAHIGLVGAYAVPFLLSDGSGQVVVLFSYTAIINIGILVLSLKKYWKPLYYAAFGLTWLMYLIWYMTDFQADNHFGLAIAFPTVFFAIFYVTFLAYKLLHDEQFSIIDILLLLANSFIFYGIGYAILSEHETGEQLLGLFTLANAIIHFIVSAIIYKQKLADRNLLYLISGLVLVFITIAVPVQVDGNWVTLLWAGEAALTFWIGRTKSVAIYEKISYPLMLLAFSSLVHDWSTVYDTYIPDQPETWIMPLFNINFLTSVMFIASFAFIHRLNHNPKIPTRIEAQQGLFKVLSTLIPATLIITLYYAFRIEIATYWNQLYASSSITIYPDEVDYIRYYKDYDLPIFRTVWIINYSLLFLSILSLFNIKKWRSQQLGLINLCLNGVAIAVFLFQGLYVLSELRESYLSQSLSEYYNRDIFNLFYRYISFAFVAILLVACYKYIRQDFLKREYKMGFDLMLYLSILWVVSSELINLMDIGDATQSYKLGLSILWGVYSFLLIALGIWKNKQHLRIGAFALFGITLIKLFFYDLTHLDTISKTIVLVSLGVLLLMISFLYNKYKHVIFQEDEK